MSPLPIGRPRKKNSANRKARAMSPIPSGPQSDHEKRSLKKLRNAQQGVRRKEALRRLGVKEQELKSVPNISSLLAQANGGLDQVIEAMRFSVSPAVESFLEVYDSTPARDRQHLPWEALVLKSGVDGTMLLGAAVLAIQNYSANAVKVIALSNHPRIMQARVASAMLPGGISDRHAIDTALGFLPSPKGSTFIINPVGKEIGKGSDDDGPEDDVDHLFPDLSDTQNDLVPAKARLLEAGS